MPILAYRGANPCTRIWTPGTPPLGFPTPHGHEPGPFTRVCPRYCPGGLAGNLTAQGVLAVNLQLRECVNPFVAGRVNGKFEFKGVILLYRKQNSKLQFLVPA